MRAPLLVLAVAGALAGAPAAAAQTPLPPPTPTPTPTPKPTIAPGVEAGGVPLGGMTVKDAGFALEAELGERARRAVRLDTAYRHFQIGPRKVDFHFRPFETARRALEAGARRPPKAGRRLEVPLVVRFDRKAVRAFVDRVAEKVYEAPRNAAVRIHLTRIGLTRSRTGRRLVREEVRPQIKAAWKDPLAPRTIHAARAWVKPVVRTRDVKARYASIITIDQSTFTLRLFKRLRYARSYEVAVGAPGYATPNGLFAIQSKQVNPTWTAPNSPWAGEAAGQSFSADDPNNPLEARWMGVNGAVGIHGTGQEYSIGTRASHGCIRMRVADVINLYRKVSIGTPVLIRP
jgi:lipoprotein-anchoring transpeptidase ErfK/SrfK